MRRSTALSLSFSKGSLLSVKVRLGQANSAFFLVVDEFASWKNFSGGHSEVY